MSDLLSFTAAQAAERIRTGEISADELFDAYRERAAADELNAFLWVADGPDSEAETSGPLAGVPLAIKDLFCVEGVPSMAGSRILAGKERPNTTTPVRNLRAPAPPVLARPTLAELPLASP